MSPIEARTIEARTIEALAPLLPLRTAPVSPFRRSAAAPRRRRRSRVLVLLRRACAPTAALVLPAGVALWVASSPRFALADVQVGVAERVPAAWVRQTLAPLAGENLPSLPLPEVARRLSAHPWVAGVELRKELPAGLVVVVVERRPAAVVARGEARFWAEESGHLIAPLAAGEPAPRLPLVREEALWLRASAREAPAVPGALAVLAELAAARPEWARGLVEIGVLSREDFRITTEALPFPLLVEAGQVEAKTRRLAHLLPQILARYERLEVVDLRFSRRIVLRPAKGAAGGDEGEPEPAETPAPEAANQG